ncbi:MAG TPA: sugar phosphate isomerase/epimerase [Bacteroidales bacterium]|nr:sugar phosphate isomerase/epimerase [Bacteroidales bacterium]
MKKGHSRRDFIRLAGSGAAGAFLLAQSGCTGTGAKAKKAAAAPDPKSFGIGLQLYTIRDEIFRDVPGSLKKVSDMGYKYVELAGYENGKFYGYEPAEFRKLVEDLGMEILSSHTQVEAQGITLENATKMAEDHAKLGVKYCIQPWIVPEARTTIASYQKMAADWNQVGKIMKDYGILFGYHNHNFEFANVEGKIPYFDVMMAELDREYVTLEIDVFWVTKAGQDPVEIINKYPGRFELFHLKDMFTRQDPFFTTEGVADFAPVGEGLIDFGPIIAAKETAGMKYMIVEQDLTKDGDCFGAIQKSITNLTTKILV